MHSPISPTSWAGNDEQLKDLKKSLSRNAVYKFFGNLRRSSANDVGTELLHVGTEVLELDGHTEPSKYSFVTFSDSVGIV